MCLHVCMCAWVLRVNLGSSPDCKEKEFHHRRWVWAECQSSSQTHTHIARGCGPVLLMPAGRPDHSLPPQTHWGKQWESWRGKDKKRGKRREELYRAERGQADKDGDRERHGKTEADNDGGKQKDGENDVSRRFGVRKKRWQQTHGKKGKGRCGWVIHWCACCSGRWSEGSRDRERGGIMRKDRERNGKAVERGRGGDRQVL